jgi:hypothetical protein
VKTTRDFDFACCSAEVTSWICPAAMISCTAASSASESPASINSAWYSLM